MCKTRNPVAVNLQAIMHRKFKVSTQVGFQTGFEGLDHFVYGNDAQVYGILDHTTGEIFVVFTVVDHEIKNGIFEMSEDMFFQFGMSHSGFPSVCVSVGVGVQPFSSYANGGAPVPSTQPLNEDDL
jgi:hypothetical protein